MTTSHNADPMTVYLLIDGEEPVAVPGIADFNLTVENPEVNEERKDARQVNPRRTQQLRRRRRANPGDLNLTLDYDPCDWVHQELLAAGEDDVRLTLRFAVRDGTGYTASAQDVDCSVLRYNISCASGTGDVLATTIAPTSSRRTCACSATATSAAWTSLAPTDASPRSPLTTLPRLTLGSTNCLCAGPSGPAPVSTCPPNTNAASCQAHRFCSGSCRRTTRIWK